MIKQLNRILKLVGFNLVRAKRRKVKWTGRLTISTAGPEIDSPLLPKCSDGEAKLSDYMDDYKWKNIPDNPSCAVGKSTPCATVSNPGKTHYVGDDCPGGHRVGTENICIGPEAKVHVVDPDAAFVPVDIGVNDHKMTDTEHESKR